jgi:phenylacetate-CoA ligase
MNDLIRHFYARMPAPLRSVAASLHGMKLRAWRFGPETDRLVEEALEREHWTPDRLRAWQDERIAWQLHRAATRVPYYRAHWQQRRQRGDTAGWEYLENWPVLEKETVRARPLAFVADDCDPRHMLHERTSGTSGKPLDLWRRRATMREFYALSVARSRGWHGVGRDDRWAILGGQVVTPIAQRKPPFWVWNRAMRQLYMSTFHLAPDLVPHYLDALVRYRITYLFGYTSSLLPLAHETLAAGRTDVRLKVVITNAEPLTDDARDTIGRAFACPVRETYGMAELVTAASECGAGCLHLWPEVGWTEVHDSDGRAAPAGALGELIGTGIINPDMPFIRYRAGDFGRLAAADTSCACGRMLPRIDRIVGRTNDLLLTRDGRRVYWLNPVFYSLPIRQGQIVQDTLDRVRIRYAPAPGFTDGARAVMAERIRARLGDVDVVLEEVDELPRTHAGKVQTVICRIPPEERDAVLSARRRRSIHARG